MDEILKIVLDCNKERKLLSNDDVKRICEIIVHKARYEIPFDVIFAPVYPPSPECGGLCTGDTIMFFKQGIDYMLDVGYQSLVNNLQMDGSKIDIYNYYYLFTIFHELAHIRQKYMMDNYPKKLESKIFSVCEPFIQNEEFYDPNHDVFPTEVNANSLAGVRVCSLYTKMPREYVSQNDINGYQLLTVQNMLQNIYEVDPVSEGIISPSELFIKAICDNIDLKEKDFYDLVEKVNGFYNLIYKTNNMTLYQKLVLGLPISFDEYARVDLLYRTLENGEDINLIKKLQKKSNSTNS